VAVLALWFLYNGIKLLRQPATVSP